MIYSRFFSPVMYVFQFYIPLLTIRKVVNYLLSDGTRHKMSGTYEIAYHTQFLFSCKRLSLSSVQECIRYTQKYLSTWWWYHRKPNAILFLVQEVHMWSVRPNLILDFFLISRMLICLLLFQKEYFSLFIKERLSRFLVFWTLENAWCVYFSACFLVTLSKRGWVFACIVVALVYIHSPTNY